MIGLVDELLENNQVDFVNRVTIPTHDDASINFREVGLNEALLCLTDRYNIVIKIDVPTRCGNIARVLIVNRNAVRDRD